MDNTNEQTKEQPANNAGDRDLSKITAETERANAAAERLEKANKEAQELQSRRILGGNTEAGKQPEPKKEESAREYARRLANGNVASD